MLKRTEIELDLITDFNVQIFIQNGIRVDNFRCCKISSQANNKYMNNDYNPNKSSELLSYLDAKQFI